MRAGRTLSAKSLHHDKDESMNLGRLQPRVENSTRPAGENGPQMPARPARNDRGETEFPDGLTIYERQQPSSTWALWLALGLAFVLSVAIVLSSVNEAPKTRLADNAPRLNQGNDQLVEGAIVATSEAAE